MKKFFICGTLVIFFGFVGISAACDHSLSFVENCPSCKKEAVRERVIEREVAVERVRAVNVLAVRTPRTPIRDRLAARAAIRASVRASVHSCSGQAVLLQTSCSCAGR